MATDTTTPDSIPIIVHVRDEGWPGFWSAGVHWPNGTTRAAVAPEVFARMLEEREIQRQAWRMTITRTDTDEMLAALPELDRRSPEEIFEADRARADAIERRRARAEEEERELRALEAGARANDAALVRGIEERRARRAADKERVARILAEEDAAAAEKAKTAHEAAKRSGVWRDVIRKTAP
jgi:hypothetical protein